MSRIVGPLLVASVVLVSFPPQGIAEKSIPGVKGTLFLVEKNDKNAGQVDTIRARVGDKIEITWTYPIVPGSIASAASAESDSGAVKFQEIRRVVRHLRLGSGTLGAFFDAKKAGKAILTFRVKSGKPGGGDTGFDLKCEVEVVRK